MVLNPNEVINITVQPEETTTAAGEIRNRFKKLSLIFGGKSKSSNPEESPIRQPFAAIFSKKPPKPDKSPPDKPSGTLENDWTFV